MASIPQCRAALDLIGQRLGEVDEHRRRELIVERTVLVRVSDLGADFHMRLTQEGITDIRSAANGASAQVRVTLASDDLLALAEDRLGFAAAFLSGRVRVKASLKDLMRVRKLL